MVVHRWIVRMNSEEVVIVGKGNRYIMWLLGVFKKVKNVYGEVRCTTS